MTVVAFTIDGPPMGKGRPRIGMRAGRPIMYQPKETVAYEARIAAAAATAMKGRAPIAEPVRLQIVAIMPVPASWSKKKRAAALAGLLWPTGKPDLDNFIKLADALNEIAWTDDAIVVEIAARKRYGDPPRLEFKISPI